MSKPTAVRTNASALLVPFDKSAQRFLVLQQGCEQRQGQRAGGHLSRAMVSAQEQSTAVITHVPPQGQRRGRYLAEAPRRPLSWRRVLTSVNPSRETC